MASLSLPSNPLMKTDTGGANLPIEVEYTQEDYEEDLFRGRKLGHLKNSITKGKSNIWGMLGEKVVQKWVNGVLADTHDYDILSPEGIKLEVKTKKTTLRQPPKAHFECSVCNHNLKQKCDMYVLFVFQPPEIVRRHGFAVVYQKIISWRMLVNLTKAIQIHPITTRSMHRVTI